MPIAVPGITGVIVNSQGAAVSGASVVAKNLQTGVETRAQTNDKGSFILSALAPGAYQLTTTAPGLVRDQRQVEVSSVAASPLRIELQDGAPRTLMLPIKRLPAPQASPEPQFDIGRPPQKPIDTQIDGQLDALKNGRIVFNPPKQMQAGKDETVTVRISKSLAADLTKGLLGSGDPQTQTIKVAPEMGVTLKGPADYFTVNLMNSAEKQVVTDSDATQWLFDILPLKAGRASLVLTAYVVLDTPDGPEQHDYPVFTRDIDIITAPTSVPSDVLGFLANNWDKLIAAIVSTGLLGWIVARFTRKSGAKNKTSRRAKSRKSEP
jgi:hypothetical protein